LDPRHERALLAILEDVERIRAYVAAAGPAWQDDDMAVDAIAKRLEDAGEQAKLLPAELLLLMPEVDWRSVKGLRDFLVHNYRSVVVGIIASTLDDDLPVLAETVRRFLASDDPSKGQPA
jgi:uncharacterized protein with HEPN domain